MISIEMITKNDNFINKSIDAILDQDYQNYEIIIVDSSDKSHYSEYQNREHIIYVYDKNSNFLKSRYNANKIAKGDYVLLMDSTRIIKKDLLRDCITLIKTDDMIIIPEISKSKAKLLNEDKELPIKTEYILSNCNPINGIFIPRFYKRELLDKAFKEVLRNTEDKIDNICSLEDRMLYLEAFKISEKIGVYKNYIIHREANSLISYIKKYYRYGRCNYYIFSRIDNYSYLANPKVKSKNKNPLIYNNSIKTKMLFFIRSISFILGFTIK